MAGDPRAHPGPIPEFSRNYAIKTRETRLILTRAYTALIKDKILIM